MRPSFLAASISSGGPKFCAAAGVASAAAKPSVVKPSPVRIDVMPIVLPLLSLHHRRHPARPTLLVLSRPLESQVAKPISTASSTVCTRLKAAALPVLPPS